VFGFVSPLVVLLFAELLGGLDVVVPAALPPSPVCAKAGSVVAAIPADTAPTRTNSLILVILVMNFPR
jgi:hypothetical protein